MSLSEKIREADLAPEEHGQKKKSDEEPCLEEHGEPEDEREEGPQEEIEA